MLSNVHVLQSPAVRPTSDSREMGTEEGCLVQDMWVPLSLPVTWFFRVGTTLALFPRLCPVLGLPTLSPSPGQEQHAVTCFARGLGSRQGWNRTGKGQRGSDSSW